jgi:hypothetical protein
LSIQVLSVQGVVDEAKSAYQHFAVNREQVVLSPEYLLQAASEATHPLLLVKHPFKKPSHYES